MFQTFLYILFVVVALVTQLARESFGTGQHSQEHAWTSTVKLLFLSFRCLLLIACLSQVVATSPVEVHWAFELGTRFGGFQTDPMFQCLQRTNRAAGSCQIYQIIKQPIDLAEAFLPLPPK